MRQAIDVQDVFKQYPGADKPAVNGLTFRFPCEKICGLLGPNGAGKTTTLSLLCGLLQGYEGRLEVMGLDVKKEAEQIRKICSVVPQQIALFHELSCEENLLYIGRLYCLPAARLRTRINFLLAEFGLEAHRHKRIKHFSGGMKRRANIMASLLHEPSLLILDEPTAGVDVQSRHMILRFLRTYHQQGHSILYTSHLLEEASELCEEVLIIDQGQTVIQGNPATLIQQHKVDNLEALFLLLTGSTVRDAC